MFASGDVGICRWAFFRGASTDAMVEQLVTHIHGSRPREGTVLIDIAYDITFPSALQRTRIAEAVKDALGTHRRLISGHAVVTNSAVTRATMTAINWLVRPQFPEQIFSDPASALAWLNQLSPTVDVDATQAAIRAAVPGFDRLAW